MMRLLRQQEKVDEAQEELAQGRAGSGGWKRRGEEELARKRET